MCIVVVSDRHHIIIASTGYFMKKLLFVNSQKLYTEKLLLVASSSADTMENNSSFVCPYPLVYADGLKNYADKYTTHWAYQEGNCAVRCPSIALTVDEFDSYNENVFRISVVSFILSFMVLLVHIPDIKKYYVRVLFISGFTLSSICFVIFKPLNKDYSAICSADYAHYIEQAPECVMQATLLVFSFLWIALWGAVYSIDTYLVTLLIRRSKLATLRSYYIWFVGFTASLLACIGLMTDSYGYDYTTSLPNCMYLFSEEGKDMIFWWVLIFPYSLCVTVCIVASIGTAYRLQTVFVKNRKRQSANKSATSGVASGVSNSGPPGSTSQLKAALPAPRPANGEGGPKKVVSTASEWTTGDSDGGAVGREWSVDVDCLPTTHPSYRQGGNDSSGLSGSMSSTGITSSRVGQRDGGEEGEGEAANPLHIGRGVPSRLTAVRESTMTSMTHNDWDDSSGRRETEMGSGSIQLSESSELKRCEDTAAVKASAESYQMRFHHDDDDDDEQEEVAESDVDIEALVRDKSRSRSKNSRVASTASYGIGASGGRSYSTAGKISEEKDFEVRESSLCTVGSADARESAMQSSGSNTHTSSARSGVPSVTIVAGKDDWLHTLSWTFSETWKYNGRVLIFIVIYCALSLYVIPTFIYLFHSTYQRNVDSADEWVGCLIVASFISPVQTQSGVDSFARATCGSHPDPRPPYNLVSSYVIVNVSDTLISIVSRNIN
jgi:hypothetical protein